MSRTVIESLKRKIVAAELRDMGITDQNTVLAVAARVQVEDNGALTGLDRDGNPGIGSGPNYQIAIADIVSDIGASETPKAAAPRVQLDPNGKGFNLTAALAAARNDSEAHAELMARLAPRPMMPGDLR